MASPAMPVPLPDHLRCQNEGCPNPVAVAVVRLEDGESDQFCMACCMIFWLAVLDQARQNGALPDLAPAATTG
jgi:hypothetical protein